MKDDDLDADLFGHESTADISLCGKYRYSLTRQWSDAPTRVLWIMLNPSTADASVDDPTIRKCIGFSRRWDARSLEVVNLFAYRSTDPDALPALTCDRVGDRNGAAIRTALDRCTFAVAAWGAMGDRWPEVATRGLMTYALAAKLAKPLRALRTTKAGHPQHPLYVPYTAIPAAWGPRP